MNELDLFAAAVAVADPAERAALLDRQCAGQPEVRSRIDQLLDAHFQSQPRFDQHQPENTGAYFGAEGVGTVIAGRYKLLEEIGEGGMGTVWVAEQFEPVKRKVALKLIKAGMDSKSVLARFEAERQALALMDHPNIAKVLDGGLTPAGRPFFVMDYVKGVPITEYCDAVRMSVAQRLVLFVQVCQAMQHAHQKGIIHRDLKPSNILVAPYDDKPVPKIIDFGLAKAMHQSLTERTLHTAHELVLGTPLYMSPEQAQLNNLDVDTRTDIYSLGVLLYELLTGTTPLERMRFKQAAWDEVRRIIREEDPPPPSTRLSSIATLPSLAAGRKTEPARLRKLVRGDLDWITMRALEKDRTRRYETANGLARDVQRYLSDEPVEACPPSMAYRLRKFARKNRGLVAAAGIIAALLTIGVIGTSVGFVRAERLRQLAEANAVEARRAAAAELRAKQDEADQRRRAQASQGQAMDALRATTDDVVDRLIGEKPVLGPAEKAFLEAALLRWQTFADQQGDSEQAREIRAEGARRVAALRLKLGQVDESLTGYLEAVATLTRLTVDFPKKAEYRLNLAGCLIQQGDALRQSSHLAEAEAATRRALALLEPLNSAAPVSPECRLELGRAHVQLGTLTRAARKWDERPYRMALAVLEPLAAEYPDVPVYAALLAAAYNGLGITLKAANRPEAEGILRRAVELNETMTKRFPAAVQYRSSLAWNYINLGNRLADVGQRAEAAAAFRRAVALQERMADDFPAVPGYRADLAWSYYSLSHTVDNGGEPMSLIRRATALNEGLAAEYPTVPDYRRALAACYLDLGILLQASGALAESQGALDQAIAIQTKLTDDFPAIAHYREGLVNVGARLERAGRHAEAVAVSRQAVAAYKRWAANSSELAMALVTLGRPLLAQGEWAEAELALRECLAIRKQKEPDAWHTFNAQSMLGGALLGQKKYAEAEPLLIEGYQGLKARERNIPARERIRIVEAIERLIELYTATNRSDEANEWIAERAKYAEPVQSEVK